MVRILWPQPSCHNRIVSIPRIIHQGQDSSFQSQEQPSNSGAATIPTGAACCGLYWMNLGIVLSWSWPCLDLLANLFACTCEVYVQACQLAFVTYTLFFSSPAGSSIKFVRQMSAPAGTGENKKSAELL